MKVCIIGAGAIGGFIGARLALAGHCEVSAVARGATLAALQTQGWRLEQDGAQLQAPARAVADGAGLGVQDLIVIAVKGPALAEVAQTLAPLMGAHTIVLPAMNGVPWWFGTGPATVDHKDGAHGAGATGDAGDAGEADGDGAADAPLDSVDPGGRIAAAIAREKVLGCVVHIAASSPEPGLVRHQMGRGLIIGEPDGGSSVRAQRVCELFEQAGFEVTHSPRIRYDIWYKLWGNLTINPVSAMTGATADRLLDDELVRAFCAAAMQEAGAIGARIGCRVDQSPEDRQAVTRKLGAFRSSMLQDVDAGRAIELDSIVAAVRELGQRVHVATPNIDALLGLTRLFARVHGLYPAA